MKKPRNSGLSANLYLSTIVLHTPDCSRVHQGVWMPQRVLMGRPLFDKEEYLPKLGGLGQTNHH